MVKQIMIKSRSGVLQSDAIAAAIILALEERNYVTLHHNGFEYNIDGEELIGIYNKQGKEFNNG